MLVFKISKRNCVLVCLAYCSVLELGIDVKYGFVPESGLIFICLSFAAVFAMAGKKPKEESVKI